MPETQQWPASEIHMQPLAVLVPYAGNARTHSDEQVAQIVASMVEWGFTNPVLCDEGGGVIAGHGRILAAQELGLEQVPTVVARGWTDAQKRAYVLADNQLAMNAGWDDGALSLELGKLEDDGFDLSLIGFDDAALSLAMTPQDDQDEDSGTEPQAAAGAALREKWGVEDGQVWQLGSHRIACGDSTDPAVVDRLLGDVRPHLMVTDPPYGVEYEANWRNEALRSDGTPSGGRAVGVVQNDDNADWSGAYALFPGDVAYVWHAPTMQDVFSQSLLDAGFEIRSQIIWVKSHFAIGRGHYHPKHELCFYVVRKGATGHWNGDRKQTTVWEIDKPLKSETGHSTQKPLECMARPIRNNSLRGEYVYEPFSGSGTTIIACENLGRKCLAVELSPEYVAIAIQRWADHTGGEPEKVNG